MPARKALILSSLAFGFFAGAADSQEAKDMHLEDVGFVMRPANTQAQLDHLRLLPPLKFVARTKNGRRYYLFADPDLCKCVFIGNQAAMDSYRDLVSPPSLPPGDPGNNGAIVPTRPSFESNFIQDMEPAVSGQIDEGDILDYDTQ
jgi:hypothetical protein